MRIKLFAAARGSCARPPPQARRIATASCRAAADLCRPRRSRAGAPVAAHVRIARARAARRERGAERRGRAPALPGRGRRRRADSRRRRHARRGSAISSTCRTIRAAGRRESARGAANMLVLAAPGAESAGRAPAGRARRPAPLSRREPPSGCARSCAKSSAARRAAANHRHRPRLPRPGLAAGRERDPDLPADRRRPPDLADRAAPPGRAAALVGRADARSSTRRRRRRRPNTLLWYRLACTLPARLPRPTRCARRAPTRRRRSRPITGW